MVRKRNCLFVPRRRRRKSFRPSGWSFYLAGVLWCSSTSSAYAYIDFGMGSMLIQLALGGIAGGTVIVKFYWARIKNFSKRLFSRNGGEDKRPGSGDRGRE